MNDSQTICPGCSLGCRVTLQHENGQIVNIFPTGDSENGNLLCPAESLLPLFQSEQQRITQPICRLLHRMASPAWPVPAAPMRSITCFRK